MLIFKEILEKEVLKTVIAEGGGVYFVGGCVRDFILGKKPKDIDIIINNLEYELIISILSKFGKVDTVGESFGVIKFKEFESNFELDIALPRTDKKNKNLTGHKSIIAQSDPYLPIEKDLERRDFTINSIAIDSNLNCIDPFNGLKHIEQKLIVVTNKKTFNDDPLRMLRAIQFSARFNFELDEKTEDLIFKNRKKINEITPERILTEFQKVFDKYGDIHGFLSKLMNTGLFNQIFGHGCTYHGVINDNSISILEIKTLADLLFYCCIGQKGYKDFDLINHLQNKFKIDTNTVKQIKALDKFFDQKTLLVFKQGVLNQLCFDVLQIWPKAYELGLIEMYFKKYLEKGYPKSYRDLILSGQDIIRYLEIKEGPIIGKVQKALLEEVLADCVRNDYIPDAVDFIKRYKDNYL